MAALASDNFAYTGGVSLPYRWGRYVTPGGSFG